MMITRSRFHDAAVEAHVLFRNHGWVWSWGEGPNGIPTVAQIEQTFQDMVERIEHGDAFRIRTGRLFAERDDVGTVEYGVHVILGTT